MKQVIQSVSGGPIRVVDVPRPSISPTEVLVKTLVSTISPGTERAVTHLAQANLLSKARARPDLVRQVLNKARTEGVRPTIRAVRSRLDEHLPLGYSASGIALEVGAHVSDVVPGQLVATGGAGKANHAEFQAVPSLLCATVPARVVPEDAAVATIASIGLHALRLSEVGPGAKIVILGLGLVGQITARLARAAGCEVAALDIATFPVERAQAIASLALIDTGPDTTKAVLDWSRGRGADAIIVTAAGRSSDVLMRTPELARHRAPVVVVGDVGLHLERTPFYEKELTIRFARSYGPGRYDQSYEEWAVDYPPEYVRWTEGRNIEAVLDLMSAGSLQVSDLVTHRFDIETAHDAYELIEKNAEPYLGIQLTYRTDTAEEKPISIQTRKVSKHPSIGLIGAGSFAASVLIPAMKAAGFDRFVSVASASGLSARRMAESARFEKVVSGAEAVIHDPDVDVVVIATPHDLHASLTAQALRAGKHVFCEKPLALDFEELGEVEAALHGSEGVLFVGFNRRWSKPIDLIRNHFAEGSGPLVITYRVNAGSLPESHWYRDRRQGGRFIGEGCHFVDTCSAIIDQTASRTNALGSGRGEPLLTEDFALGLAYPDGSIASITYASGGPPGLEKERVDVLGRDRSASLIDYKRVLLDGRKAWSGTQDKGHVSFARAFLESIQSGRQISSFIESSKSTLEAAPQIMT